MYRLVADVSCYHEFLKWCRGTSILNDSDSEVIVAIDVSFKGLNETFTTRNTMSPFQSIRMELVEGPFNVLNGYWLFDALEPHACKIELSLDFDIKNPIKKRILGPAFSYIANSQIEAFHARAKTIYR